MGEGEEKVSIEKCSMWEGCTNKDGYGVKLVTWPGQRTSRLERAHRVAYYLHHKLRFDEVARYDEKGSVLEVSHLCHHLAWVNPLHLVLEARTTNKSRVYCLREGFCVGAHTPACLFDLTS